MIDFYSPGNLSFIILNYLGLGSSVLIIIIVIFLAPFRADVRRSNAMILQIGIGVLDILRHTLRVLLKQPKGFLCSFVGFSTFFTDHGYIFFVTVIAFNLHYIFYLEKKPPIVIGSWHCIIPLLAAFFIDSIPAGNRLLIFSKTHKAFSAFGLTKRGNCFVGEDFKHRRTVIFLFKGLLTIIPLVYCLLVSIAIFMKKFKPPVLDEIHGIDVFRIQLKEQAKFTLSSARAVALYPLFCSICFFGQSISAIYSLTDKTFWVFELWKYVGLSITGILNLFALISNPSIRIAFYGFVSKKDPLGNHPTEFQSPGIDLGSLDFVNIISINQEFHQAEPGQAPSGTEEQQTKIIVESLKGENSPLSRFVTFVKKCTII